MAEQTSRKALCFEPVFNGFHDWAKQQIDSVPEIRSLVLVVDWRVGQNDFPASMNVRTEKSAQSECATIQQLVKTLKVNLQSLSDTTSKQLNVESPPATSTDPKGA